MVPAVHVLEPGRVHGDSSIVRHRVRAGTMAAEGLLHDLGVIAMLSSDSQGMGRVGEVVRRAFQNAAAMRALRGAGAGPADNERVLRHLAKVTINPAIAHGLAAHVGSLEPASSPTSCSGSRICSACGRRSCSRRASPCTGRPARATRARACPSRCCCGARSAATARRRPCSRSPSSRARRSPPICRRASGSPSRLPRPHGGEHGAPRPHGRCARRCADARRHARRRAGRRPAAGGGGALRALPARMSEPDPDALASALVGETVALALSLHGAIAGLAGWRRAARRGAGGCDLRAAAGRQAASPRRAPVGRARRAGRRRRRARARARGLRAGRGQPGARAARAGVLLRRRRPPQRRLRPRRGSRPRGRSRESSSEARGSRVAGGDGPDQHLERARAASLRSAWSCAARDAPPRRSRPRRAPGILDPRRSFNVSLAHNSSSPRCCSATASRRPPARMRRRGRAAASRRAR